MTFATIRTKVADDLARSDLNTQIGAAINEAIAHYDNERFWFNMTRTLTFSTVASQVAYGAAAHASIPFITDVDSLIIGDGTNNEWHAILVYPDKFERLDPPTTSGQPRLYTIIADEIRLWPTPGSTVYTVRMVGWYKLADLSADGDGNVWTVNAPDLLRLSAKRRVQANVTKAYEDAQVTKLSEDEALGALRSKTVLRMKSGMIVPTQF